MKEINITIPVCPCCASTLILNKHKTFYSCECTPNNIKVSALFNNKGCTSCFSPVMFYADSHICTNLDCPSWTVEFCPNKKVVVFSEGLPKFLCSLSFNFEICSVSLLLPYSKPKSQYPALEELVRQVVRNSLARRKDTDWINL